MGGEDDPSVGDALIGFLLVGGAGVLIPAAVVLPLIGLGIWLTHRWRGRHARDPAGVERPAGPTTGRAMSAEALQWFKSTYSGSEGGECVEVATCPTAIHIRDSKNAPEDGPVFHVTPTTWAAFTTSLR
ncbi:hypothetical protein GCM10010269_76650 [Streptomyces humidus]|uniref:DUF397 domain-containing protein n=1 Tax=Streptomyces humidus TaxID=52259 RepID=A0A918GB18_9ACTN|nr:DUF397 domain-containing protein [Streptomyces humidus]GGS26729.1 hypothetical protein GCM10010269_76650 [Streptomyces humidus]